MVRMMRVFSANKVSTLILILIIGNVFMAMGQSTGRAPPPSNQTSTDEAPPPANQTASSPTSPSSKSEPRCPLACTSEGTGF